jgi:hypothetical protein
MLLAAAGLAVLSVVVLLNPHVRHALPIEQLTTANDEAAQG